MRKHIILVILCTFTFSFISCDARVVGFSVKPSKYNFEEVNIGDSEVMYFKIKNASGDLYRISKYVILGVGSEYYKIVEGGNAVTVRAGASVFIGVEFEPKTAGIHNAVILVYHNAPSSITQLTLTGTGVPVPRIEIDRTDIDYGTMLIGDSAKESVEIENTGSDILVLSSIDFSISSSPELSITSGGNTPVYMNPGEKHTIEIEFAPIADAITSNSLVIVHNAVDKGSPITVSIRGEGKTAIPGIDVDRTSTWDFGTVAITLDNTENLRVTSNGINDLHITSIDFANGAGFFIDSVLDSANQPVVFPVTLRVGASIKVAVKFAPTLVQTYNDTLVIVHDAVNTGSPLNIDVEGVGVKKPIVKTFNYSGQVVDWVVPNNITSITIEVWGAQGGGTGWGTPGKGARMKGEFTVTPGDVIKIAVGEKGETGGQGGGGGGGSFVVLNNQPLIIAGGGGGSHYNNQGLDGKDGVTTQTCTPHASTGTGYTGGSGGGWTGDGANGDYGCTGGSSWANGLAGGLKNTRLSSHWSNGDGGFGGGGGGCWAPGSAGGYNGGVSATSYGNQTPGGTGGGSYNSGTNQSNTAGANSGDGKVEITYTP